MSYTENIEQNILLIVKYNGFNSFKFQLLQKFKNIENTCTRNALL